MPRTRDEARVEQARVLASEGKTQAEVATELDMSLRTLQSWPVEWPRGQGRPRLPVGEGSRWTRRRREAEAEAGKA